MRLSDLLRFAVLLAALPLLLALLGYAVGGATWGLIGLAAVPLFIANPLSENSLSRLYSTHPPASKPAARLRQLADE
jgi:hypothetical protein